MTHQRCRACRGEYSTVLPDGTSYFHACPPLPPLAPGETGDGAVTPGPPPAGYRPRDENPIFSARDREGRDTMPPTKRMRAEGDGVDVLP